MNQISVTQKSKNIKSTLLIIIIIAVFAMYITNPQKYSGCVLYGVRFFYLYLLPSLLPFFFLTKLLTSTGNVNSITTLCRRPLKKLFKLPPQTAYIMFMSVLSGYPVGAKLVSELCFEDKHNTTRIAVICSTSGIIFTVGTIGAMLENTTAAVVLYASHIISAVFFALTGNITVKNTHYAAAPAKNDVLSDNALSESIYSSIMSLLCVGGFIAVFFMFADMLDAFFHIRQILSELFNICGIPSGICEGLSNGIIEITRGCHALSQSASSLREKLCATAFLVTFGGFCVIMQIFSFLSSKIYRLKFIVCKLAQGILCALLCYILCLVFNI